jgi:hypothetical protein
VIKNDNAEHLLLSFKVAGIGLKALYALPHLLLTTTE